MVTIYDVARETGYSAPGAASGYEYFKKLDVEKLGKEAARQAINEVSVAAAYASQVAQDTANVAQVKADTAKATAR